mmetsp:Transcript_13274/g.18509  ORF Transcript_13274/g.18509 Transcript_13274/m.18509 type:complete len:694 (+) Transcript_13274:124-2205(+)
MVDRPSWEQDTGDWDSANAGVSASQRNMNKNVDSTIATTPPRQSKDVPDGMLKDRKSDTKAATTITATPDTAASTPPAASMTTRKEIPSSYVSIITDTYGVSSDLYALLQVPRTATTRDIRISYFRRGRQVLTDTGMVNGGAATSATVGGVSEQAKMRFQAVSMAYEILSDEDMRATYDAFGLQARSEDDAFVNYSGNIKGSQNSPVADFKEVIIKPTERVRSSVRWNEEVEELVFEKDKFEVGGSLNDSIQALSGSDDSSDDGSQRRQRMKKGRRKKKRSKKKKIVVVDNDELNRHLEQLDDEYDNAKANQKDFVNDYLDALETSFDGLLGWKPQKTKERDSKEKGEYDSEPPTTDDDDSSIEAGIPRQRGPPPPRSSKAVESSPPRNKEIPIVELPPQPVIQKAQPRMINEKETGNDYYSKEVVPNNNTDGVVDQEILNKGFTVTANRLDCDSVSAMSQNTFNRASPVAQHSNVVHTPQEAVLDPKLKTPRVVVEEEEEEFPMDEPTVQSTSLSSRQGSRTSIATEEVGNCQRWCGDDGGGEGDGDLKFAANWLLAGDGHKDISVVSQEELSRELKDASLLSTSMSTNHTEEPQIEPQEEEEVKEKKHEQPQAKNQKDVAEIDMMTDFAAYLYNYLRAITDEVTKCATAVASSEIFDGTRDVLQSITVSDDDLSNMLGILKREMDRTPMPH